jgi:hypothetical protein
MNPITVSYNQAAADHEVNQALKTVYDINAAVQKFFLATGFRPSKDDLINFVYNHGQDAKWELNEKLKKFLDSEMNNLGITSSLMRSKFKEGNEEIINRFTVEIHKISTMDNIDHLNELVCTEGVLSLPLSDQEAIRDKYRIKLTTPRQKEFYDMLVQTAGQLQALREFCRKHTIIQQYALDQIAINFFKFNEAGKVEPAPLDYQRAVPDQLELQA